MPIKVYNGSNWVSATDVNTPYVPEDSDIKITFHTSSNANWTLTSGYRYATVHCIGGGGGCGNTYAKLDGPDNNWDDGCATGGGGGGAYAMRTYSHESLNNGAVLSVGGGGAGGPAGWSASVPYTSGAAGGDSIFNPNDGSAVTLSAEGGGGVSYCTRGQSRLGGTGGDGSTSNGYIFKSGETGEDGYKSSAMFNNFLPGKSGYLSTNNRTGLDSELIYSEVSSTTENIASQGIEGDQTTFFGQYIGSGDYVGEPWGFGANGKGDWNNNNDNTPYYIAGNSGRDGVIVIVEYK